MYASLQRGHYGGAINAQSNYTREVKNSLLIIVTALTDIWERPELSNCDIAVSVSAIWNIISSRV